MKKYLILIPIFYLQYTFAQVNNDIKLLSNFSDYDILLKYNNDFNNDKVQDILYILSSKKENGNNLINSNDSISKRKLIIFLGTKKNNFVKVLDNDDIVPCRECLGKSDNFVSDLVFKNNLFSYSTCISPLASDRYSVINFTLKFIDDTFYIYKYKETYSTIETDENAKIVLDNQDIPNKKFSYYDWIANKNWIDYVNITNQNLTKLNDFAYKLESINPSISINILQKILKKFPTRVVAYLNLADSYWAIGNEDLAKENYKKYVELMKFQKKDLRKIPKQVWERAK